MRTCTSAVTTRAAAARGARRAGPAAAGGVLVLLLLGGCPAPDPVPPGATRLSLRQVAAGLAAPVDLAAPNDDSGRLLIADQIGLIHVVTAAGLRLPVPLLDVRDRLDAPGAAGDERGLLGLALHPDFPINGRLFICYNAPPGADAPAGSATELRLSEFRMRALFPDQADPASERILLRLAKPQANHNGGQVAFGPDGLLYLAVGDGGGAGDAGFGHTPGLGNAQDRSNLLGAILRIDVDAGDPYAVPPGNPFVGLPGARGEIYAYGLRNPWRFSFDVGPGGATRLLAADVGQALTEEVNLIERGGNYGWNIREGSLCFDPARPQQPPAECPATAPDGAVLRPPILEYRHADALDRPQGTAVVGGFVYRGSAVPALRGLYIFGDYSTGFALPNGRLFAAAEAADGTWSFEELAVAGTPDGRLGRFLLALGRDAAGELYLLTRTAPGATGTTGAVFRIVAAG